MTTRQATFEKVAEILQEVSELQKISEQERREFQKISEQEMKEIRESQKATNRQIEETGIELKEMIAESKERSKAADKRMRELDELFNGQWGKLMESLVEGDLVKLLRARGIKVERMAQRTEHRSGNENYEFDLIAINSHEVVVVEVKTTLRLKHIDHFLRKLESFKRVFHEYSDKTVYGAVAYLKANEGSHRKAAKEGLFVIRATGSSASISNAEHFKPKAF